MEQKGMTRNLPVPLYTLYISLKLVCVLALTILTLPCYAAPNPSVVKACSLLDEFQRYARSYQIQDGRGHIIDPYLQITEVHHCLENIPTGEVKSEILEAAIDYKRAGVVADYAGNPMYRSGYEIVPPRRVFDIFLNYRIAQETSFDGEPGLVPQDLFDVDSKGRLTKSGVSLTQEVLEIIWRSASLHIQKARMLEGIVSSKTVYGSDQDQFLSAIDHNELGDLKTWLAKGASINQLDRHGDAPLIRAFSSGRLEIVNQLLIAGASLNHEQANNALMLTSRQGYNSLTKLLILKGADVNTKEKTFDTSALEVAVQAGQSETVRLLLTSGADVNATNDLNQTSLWWAANYDFPQIVKLLLSSGADRNIKNVDGKTPVAIAEEKQFDDITTILGPENDDSQSDAHPL
ncbi:MAG: ankyrin repeat domain-containing protein [Janthinobacterium lividum]